MSGSWILDETVEASADKLSNCWAVRPKGALGTCGFHPVPWGVIYVGFKAAPNEAKAIAKARMMTSRIVMYRLLTGEHPPKRRHA